MNEFSQMGHAPSHLPQADPASPVYPGPFNPATSRLDTAGLAAVVTAATALAVHLLYSFLSGALSSNLHTYRYLFDGLGHLEWVLCGAAVTAGLLGRRSVLGKIGLALGAVALALAFTRFANSFVASL